MGGKWNAYNIRLWFFSLLITAVEIQGHCSLNSEGLTLLKFRAGVYSDPHGVFENWNPNDCNPCVWSGVHCVDGKVQMLDLNGLSLQGVVASELGELSHLKTLILSHNHFSGAIPKEFGELMVLEVLDLRDNDFTGPIPAELGGMQSLKRLLLCNNKLEGSIPSELRKLSLLSEVQFDENLTSAIAAGIGCINRKFGHCLWQGSLKPFKKADSFIIPIKVTMVRYLNLLRLLKFEDSSSQDHTDDCCDNRPTGSSESDMVQNLQTLVNIVRRRLVEQSSNLAAAPVKGGAPPNQVIALPSSRSSGSFPAVAKEKMAQSPSSPPVPLPTKPPTQVPPNKFNHEGQSKDPTGKQDSGGGTSGRSMHIILGISGAAFFLIAIASMMYVCRRRAVSTIGPWRTGLSGQLQKAFVTGVPKLNRDELETACEDFSNIIDTHDYCTMYKGTLSSGVEICVVSTSVTSLKDWSKRAEMAFRKKIDTLSQVNHKNFVNLIGYCEEDEPFVRMMVFEYAPNGSLSDYLHVKEVEDLDWNARVRIIMGTAYCLQYMHDLNPPVPHANLNSNAIFLTDDYAAKIAEISFWKEFATKTKNSGEGESEHSELPPLADAETNVYSFGILLLEIISGKLPHTEEQGSLVNWAAQYLNDKRSISYMIDPTLKSFKNNELDVICEVIQDCIQTDPRKRLTVREIISKLRQEIDISPESATPRLSPLWWAELEILSAETA